MNNGILDLIMIIIQADQVKKQVKVNEMSIANLKKQHKTMKKIDTYYSNKLATSWTSNIKDEDIIKEATTTFGAAFGDSVQEILKEYKK